MSKLYSTLPPRGHYRAHTRALFAGISDKAFRLWHLLAAYGWDGNGCRLDNATLGHQLGISERWVRELLRELVEAGLLIEIVSNGQRALKVVYAGELLAACPPAPACQPEDSPVEVDPLQIEMVKALRPLGVYPGPAADIARQAIQQGVSLAEVIAAFKAHMQDTGNNIKMTTWRLQQGLFNISTAAAPPEDPDLARLADLLIDRCGSSPASAMEAVRGAQAAWGDTWSPAVFELEMLRWLAYCLHPRYGRTLTPATYIPARLKEGYTAPGYFTDYGCLRANIAALQRRLEAAAEPEPVEAAPPATQPDPAASARPGCEPDAGQVWQQALGQLQTRMPRAAFDTWVRPAVVLSCEQATLTLGVQSAAAREWLEHRLKPLIVQAVSDHLGRAAEVRFVVWQDGDKAES